MIYNIIYKERLSFYESVILALTEEDLQSFVNAYELGEDCFFHFGIEHYIGNISSVEIFDCSNTKTQVGQQDVYDVLNKLKRATEYSDFPDKVRGLGRNVVHKYIKGTYGNRKGNAKTTLSPAIKISKKAGGKIFISHSVKNKEIVRAFTENILQIGLGLEPGKDIFNISIEDAGIETGADFKKRIENELTTAKAVIQIITSEYKESEVCLNEMGAAWGFEFTCYPLYIGANNSSNCRIYS